MIKKKDLKEILFIDIETVSTHPSFDELEPVMQDLWAKKSKRFRQLEIHSDDEHYASSYMEKAGIFAEFAKIVCITVGYLSKDRNSDYSLKVKTYASHVESEILSEFCMLLDRHFDDPDRFFICGHNIKEFDIPFICRRLVILGMHLPRMLNIAGKKPWQVTYLLDTMEMWKFGDYKNYTSLALLSAVLSIPSPKDDIDGSQVGDVYWKDDDLDRIVSYCEKDVVTVAQIAMHFSVSPLLLPENIDIIHPNVPKRKEI